MNLKQIESFVAVADTKGFSQAASILYITQPTVSAHISSLESELNTRLIARTTKTVELTDQGKEFYNYSVQMLELQRKMMELFVSSPKEETNVLRICASSIPAQYILPQVLGKFTEQFPRIKYTIKEKDSIDVIEEIVNGRADIGFTGTQTDEKECRYIHLCRDEIVIIAPNTKKYKELIENKSLAEWIISEPVIMRQVGSGTRRESERILARQGIQPSKLNIVATFDGTDTIKRAVINGMGISFVSKLAIEKEVSDKSLIFAPLDNGEKGRNLNLVYNNHLIQSKSAVSFMDIVVNHFKSAK